jgi:hypothetical protein
VAVLPSELSVTVALMGFVVPLLTSVKVEFVNVDESMVSEKVALTSVPRPTPVFPLEGLTLLTVGAIVSLGVEGSTLVTPSTLPLALILPFAQ